MVAEIRQGINRIGSWCVEAAESTTGKCIQSAYLALLLKAQFPIQSVAQGALSGAIGSVALHRIISTFTPLLSLTTRSRTWGQIASSTAILSCFWGASGYFNSPPLLSNTLRLSGLTLGLMAGYMAPNTVINKVQTAYSWVSRNVNSTAGKVAQYVTLGLLYYKAPYLRLPVYHITHLMGKGALEGIVVSLLLHRIFTDAIRRTDPQNDQPRTWRQIIGSSAVLSLFWACSYVPVLPAPVFRTAAFLFCITAAYPETIPYLLDDLQRRL